MEGEIALERQRVQRRPDPGQRCERAGVGAVGEAALRGGVAERLLAEAVAREVQHSRIAVDDRDRIHAIDAAEQAVDSPPVEALRQDLGVALRREDAPRAFELAAERAIVVDLAVLKREDAPAARCERLVARREIDDGEASHAERDARLEVRSLAVGAAMADRREQLAQERG